MSGDLVTPVEFYFAKLPSFSRTFLSQSFISNTYIKSKQSEEVVGRFADVYSVQYSVQLGLEKNYVCFLSHAQIQKLGSVGRLFF